MTDLVIINPAAAHGIYGPLGDDLIAVEPPLWVRLIAGYIRDKGFSIEIIDAEAERLTPAQVTARAAQCSPKLICIAVYGHQPSASTQQMWGARELADHLAKEATARTIIVGGHPSALPDRTLREEDVDYVGVGEGHLTVLGLLRGDEIAIIPGLVWRDGTTIRINKPAPLCEDLSELHGDVWDLLPMHLYRAHNWQKFGDVGSRQPYASIYTSLGCPYKCSFCCINAPFDSNRYRMRSPQAVVDEIVMLYRDYDVRTFKITDEMFVLNERHYMAIAGGLISSGIADKLNIWAYARVDTVRPATLAMLRRAGIRWLALGIESGSALVRDGANKKLRSSDIVGTVKAIQNAGINVIGNFIFGLRDDTVQTMQETLELAIECLPDFANFYSCMAYPGSGLYTEALAKGWMLPETWRGYSQYNDDARPLDTEYVDGARVLQFRDEAFDTFFSSAAYGRHVRDKFGMETLVHVHGMTSYKLKRKLLEPA